MYSVSIPIKHRGNSIYAKPITTFLQKEICKSLLNESNDAHIVLTFNKILEECLSISTDVLCLNIIEKLIILIRLRSISIGQHISIIVEKDNKKININYDILNVLEKIYDTYKQTSPLILSINSKITIHCGLPNIQYEKKLLIEKNKHYNIEDYLIYFIDKIYINNKDCTYIWDMSEQDRLQIYNNLPANTILKIYEYAQELYNKFYSIDFYGFFDYNLKINLFNLNINDYLKFIYREDLHNIYYSIYVMCKYLNMSPEYVENLTALERELFINFYKQEQQKNNTTSDSIPIVSGLKDTSDIDIYKNIKGG